MEEGEEGESREEGGRRQGRREGGRRRNEGGGRRSWRREGLLQLLGAAGQLHAGARLAPAGQVLRRFFFFLLRLLC